MPLTLAQRNTLYTAIQNYDFPRVIFGHEYQNMRALEEQIRNLLLSDSLIHVKNGLLSILDWGFNRSGLRQFRVDRFLNKIRDFHLEAAQQIFANLNGSGLKQIKKLGLPEYSLMPFTTKIRMFLDPEHFVVLDNKLMKLSQRGVRPFANIKKSQGQIRITYPNMHYYEEWCALCRYAVQTYFLNENIIAVDIERGIFKLIDDNRLTEAADIVTNIN